MAGAIGLFWVALAAVAAFRSGETAQGIVLSLVGAVIVAIAVRKPSEQTPDLRRTVMFAATGFAVLGIGMLALAFSEDNGVLRILAGTGGALGLLMAAVSVWALWKVRRVEQRPAAPGEVARHPDLLDGDPGGRLVFVRDESLQDALRPYTIKVDGHRVGLLSHRSSLTVQAPVGQHVCQARIQYTGSKPLTIEVSADGESRILVRPTTDQPTLRNSLSRDNYLVLQEQ